MRKLHGSLSLARSLSLSLSLSLCDSHSMIQKGSVFRDPATAMWYIHLRRLALLRSLTRGRSFHRNAQVRCVPDDHSWLEPKRILRLLKRNRVLCNRLWALPGLFSDVLVAETRCR